jgi:hypothetical protein
MAAPAWDRLSAPPLTACVLLGCSRPGGVTWDRCRRIKAGSFPRWDAASLPHLSLAPLPCEEPPTVSLIHLLLAPAVCLNEPLAALSLGVHLWAGRGPAGRVPLSIPRQKRRPPRPQSGPTQPLRCGAPPLGSVRLRGCRFACPRSLPPSAGAPPCHGCRRQTPAASLLYTSGRCW